MLSSRMFPPTQAVGLCPICGGDCKKPDGEFVNRGFTVTSVQRTGPGLQDGPEYRYQSRERVKWTNPVTGRYELLYGVGAPIPLIEALRQGVMEVSQLTEQQKAEIREHAERDPQSRAALMVALKARKPSNKMVKQQETVQK